MAERNDAVIMVGMIDDEPLYRRAFESVLAFSPEFKLTGLWDDTETAFLEINAAPPDIVLIDIRIKNMKGIECIRQLKKLRPQIQFLVFTGHDQDDESLFKALKAGASGYLLKKEGLEVLIKSLKELHAGGSPMSPSIARKIVDFFGTPPLNANEDQLFTKREEEVLTLLAEGKMYKEVAASLGIAMETAKKHVKHIYNKLEVQNRMEAVNKWRS